jgi:hypothetical protein
MMEVQLHVNFQIIVPKSHMYDFNVPITTAKDLKNVSLKMLKLITQRRCLLFKTCWKTTCQFFEKYMNTSRRSHAHLRYVHNKCARFEGCERSWLHKVGDLYSKHANFSGKKSPHAESHMHIFNMNSWLHKVGALYSKHAGKMTEFNYMSIFR